MRKVLGSALLLGLLAGSASPASAHGRASDCGEVVGPAPAADCGWTEKTVTCYRPEYRTRTVPHTVCKVVPREVEERYTYTEMVRVVTPEKRSETYCTVETKEVPYRYTVCVPVWKPEKRTEALCRLVTRGVPYTYTEGWQVWTPAKRHGT